MAQYDQKWIGPPPKWLTDLVEQELHPEKIPPSPEKASELLLEEETILFLEKLYEHFFQWVQMFNKYSQDGKNFKEVRLFHIAQTAADFMLYRNQMKLIISSPFAGSIHLTFSHQREKLPQEHTFAPHSLQAHIDPFGEVHWRLEQHPVTPEKLSRFYFSRFIQVSRSQTVSKEKLLLEHIKTLLQQKGLDL